MIDRPRRLPKLRPEARAGLLFLAPAAILYVVFMVYPFLSNIYLSLTDWNGMSPTKQFVGLDNYAELVGDSVFWSALWHKLAINCAINPFTAIADCQNGKVLNLDLFIQVWPDLREELVQMLKQAGYPMQKADLEHRVFSVKPMAVRFVVAVQILRLNYFVFFLKR